MYFFLLCYRLFYENKLLDGVTAEDRTQVLVGVQWSNEIHSYEATSSVS